MYRYKNIKIGGRVIGEHRFVMQNSLGRPLLPNELVHHINNKGRDNRIENLLVTNRSEHAIMHYDHKKSKIGGRTSTTWPKKIDYELCYIMQLFGCSLREIAKTLGVHNTTVFWGIKRYCRQHQDCPSLIVRSDLSRERSYEG